MLRLWLLRLWLLRLLWWLRLWLRLRLRWVNALPLLPNSFPNEAADEGRITTLTTLSLIEFMEL